MKLTREERKAVFAGTLKVLRRQEKPDQEAGHKIVVSSTRGGKQIVDRSTGETIDMPTQPRLWITIKGWHLKAGNKEWETAVEIHDMREQNRALSNGLGGIPREAGLKTRWGKRVVHSAGKVEVVDKRVPTKEEQHENWTLETERGYGGQDGMERSVEGDLVPATAVDDATLRRFSQMAEETNIALRETRRKGEEGMQREMKVHRETRRALRQRVKARKLDVSIAHPDGSTTEAVVELEGQKVTLLEETPTAA